MDFSTLPLSLRAFYIYSEKLDFLQTTHLLDLKHMALHRPILPMQ